MSLDIDLFDVGRDTGEEFVLASHNITHNLNKMAIAAGIYGCLWRPEEHGIETASQMIEPLRAGLARMLAEPAKMRAYDSPNGWGIYDDFLPWVMRVLASCERYPGARVRVSR